MLNHTFWGMGYGTEIAFAGKKYIKHMVEYGAFKNLNNPLTEIVATAHPENVGSIKILKKALKRQENNTINCFKGNERLFFYKPLDVIQFNHCGEDSGSEPKIGSFSNQTP